MLEDLDQEALEYLHKEFKAFQRFLTNQRLRHCQAPSIKPGEGAGSEEREDREGG
jgi:hypothetical protein